jgi:multidrug efflux pump subunit AcrA (membrane-fusion protein)
MLNGAVSGCATSRSSAATPATPLATAPITRTTLVQTVSVPGMLDYGQPNPISATGTGMLTWIAPVGSTVMRGESLFRIDDRPVVALYGSIPLYRTLSDGTALAETESASQDIIQAQAAVSSAASNLRAAESRLEGLQAGSTSADLAAAEQAVVAAQGTLQRAEADLARVEAGATEDELFRTEMTLEVARNSLWAQQINRDTTCGRDPGGGCNAANASVAAAESNVKQAQAALDALWAKPDPGEVETAQAAVATARAALRTAQARLEQTRRGATEHDLAQAQANLDSARGNYEVALAKLEQMGNDGAVGADVLQLQENLIALGYSELPADGVYSSATAEAVRAWQADLGLAQTGIIELGQVVFVPGPIQIAERTGHIGEPIRGTPVLSYTGTERSVTVQLKRTELALVTEGDQVTVRVPGQGSVTGEISRIETVVRNDTVEVTVTIADQEALGPLVAAQVDVDLVGAERIDVLAVPVAALLSLASGGYGVEVVEGNSTRIAPVRTGMFAGGRVEISGDGITEGLAVGVPR